jgi:hypothetical protein
VADELEMPESLAGAGIERNQRIGKQVIADPIRTVEIRRRRSSWGIDDAASFVEGHARPTVRAAVDRPRIF